jgi:hypothetical protein
MAVPICESRHRRGVIRGGTHIRWNRPWSRCVEHREQSLAGRSWLVSDTAPTVEELRKSVDDGLLYMEPGTAEACAAKADAWRAGLEDVKSRFTRSDYRSGFGVLDSGQRLGKGFGGKADEALLYLRRQIEIAEIMAATFRAAGRAYADQEASNATAIEGIVIDPPVLDPPRLQAQPR